MDGDELMEDKRTKGGRVGEDVFGDVLTRGRSGWK